MVNYLYPPTQGPPADLGTTSGGWFGNEFYTSSSGVSIHSVGWYRRATGTLGAATLKVRDMTTGTDVISVAAPDDGTVGWHYADLDSPVVLTPSRLYLVAIVVPSGFFVSGAPMTPDAPWSYEDGAFGPSWYSRDATNSTRFGVSVADAAVNGSGSPGTATTTDVIQVGQDLGPWLSSDSAKNVHQTDGLPWLIKTEVDATKTLAQGAYDVVTTTPSGGSNLLSFLAAMGPTILTAIGTFFATANDRLNGASGGGGSAFYGPSGTQVAEGVETLLAQGLTPTDLGAAVALLRERLDLSPDLADTTRWTLVDTIEGSGDALVNVQADAYFFNLTTIPPEHEQLGVAATLWVPHWGWAAPRVHAHFRQRQFSDVFPVVFTADGLFMDGLLIHARPGFEWTCECYTLDRT